MDAHSGPDTITMPAVKRSTAGRRYLDATQSVLVGLGLIGLAAFSFWSFAFAQDVLDFREELRSRTTWLETSQALSARLVVEDAESVRLVAARGLDLLNEMRLSKSLSGRSGELIADTSRILVEVQHAKEITPLMLDAMGQGLSEIEATVDADRAHLRKRLDERWNSAFLLVVGALALSAGLAALIFLFLRSSVNLSEAQSRLGLLVRGSRAALWEWDIVNASATFSPRWQTLVGLEPGEMSKTIEGWLHRVHPEEATSLRKQLRDHLAGETSFFECEHRIRHGSGRYRWYRVCGVAELASDGKAIAMAGSLVDISAVREAQSSVNELEFADRMLSLLDGSVALISIDRGVLKHSASFPEMLSQWRSVDEWWVQLRPSLRLPPPTPCKHCSNLALVGRVTASVRGPHSKRQVFELTFGGHDCLSSEESDANVVFVRDISEATRAAELAALEAATDENNIIDRVTGLSDRRAFLKKLSETMKRNASDSRGTFAVICLDVDGLGLVNDTLGSRAGDTLLQTIAQRLKRALGPDDTLSRIGGDEFGLLLVNLESEQAASAAISSLPGLIAAPVDLLGLEVIPTATVGATLGHSAYQDAETMVRGAEAACRSAVKGGKRSVEIVSGPVTKTTRKTLRINNDLRRALEREEFRLHYQPIIPLNGEATRGFEALLRWKHPDFGSIGPADFIPIAEASGAIVPIGLWVFQEACSRLVRWREAHPTIAGRLMMSVNVSMRQLRERDLVEQLGRILDETGVAPEDLKIEITESTVMENPDETERILLSLKALGVHLWIDDFGTGYSSLSYLQSFPIDGLKIDRAFVSPVVEDASTQQIATSIIELGHNLGLQVVAEGVETREQLSFLKSSGCDLAQGRYLGYPIDEVQADELVLQWSKDMGADKKDDTLQEQPAVLRSLSVND